MKKIIAGILVALTVFAFSFLNIEIKINANPAYACFTSDC